MFNFIILKIFIIDREKSFYFLYNEVNWINISFLEEDRLPRSIESCNVRFLFFFYHQKNKLKIGIITDDVKWGKKKSYKIKINIVMGHDGYICIVIRKSYLWLEIF